MRPLCFLVLRTALMSVSWLNSSYSAVSSIRSWSLASVQCHSLLVSSFINIMTRNLSCIIVGEIMKHVNISAAFFVSGQVQDVGLIFLSAMATDIAKLCSDAGLPASEALGTSLITFSLATLTVGSLTWLVGETIMGLVHMEVRGVVHLLGELWNFGNNPILIFHPSPFI